MNRNGLMVLGILILTFTIILPWMTAIGLLLSYVGVPGSIIAAGILILVPFIAAGLVFAVSLVVDYFEKEEEKDG